MVERKDDIVSFSPSPDLLADIKNFKTPRTGWWSKDLNSEEPLELLGDEREDVDDVAESNLKASELVFDLEADIITAGDNLKHNDKNE